MCEGPGILAIFCWVLVRADENNELQVWRYGKLQITSDLQVQFLPTV